jgi:hypothetical protein
MRGPTPTSPPIALDLLFAVTSQALQDLAANPRAGRAVGDVGPAAPLVAHADFSSARSLSDSGAADSVWTAEPGFRHQRSSCFITPPWAGTMLLEQTFFEEGAHPQPQCCARFDSVGFWKKPENADKEANRSPLAPGGRGPSSWNQRRNLRPVKTFRKGSGGENPLNLRRGFVQPGNSDNVK